MGWYRWCSYKEGVDVMTRKPQKKRRFEFSKVFCIAASILVAAIGWWMIYEYYVLVRLAITCSQSVLPDAALPIAGLTFIFAPLVSYLTYQFGLKNSRNKYGIDADGQPFKRKDGEV